MFRINGLVRYAVGLSKTVKAAAVCGLLLAFLWPLCYYTSGWTNMLIVPLALASATGFLLAISLRGSNPYISWLPWLGCLVSGAITIFFGIPTFVDGLRLAANVHVEDNLTRIESAYWDETGLYKLTIVKDQAGSSSPGRRTIILLDGIKGEIRYIYSVHFSNGEDDPNTLTADLGEYKWDGSLRISEPNQDRSLDVAVTDGKGRVEQYHMKPYAASGHLRFLDSVERYIESQHPHEGSISTKLRPDSLYSVSLSSEMGGTQGGQLLPGQNSRKTLDNLLNNLDDQEDLGDVLLVETAIDDFNQVAQWKAEWTHSGLRVTEDSASGKYMKYVQPK
jgi:hypothetical protein